MDIFKELFCYGHYFANLNFNLTIWPLMLTRIKKKLLHEKFAIT